MFTGLLRERSGKIAAHCAQTPFRDTRSPLLDFPLRAPPRAPLPLTRCLARFPPIFAPLTCSGCIWTFYEHAYVTVNSRFI